MSHCQRLPGYLNLGTMLRNKIVIYLLPLVLLVGCIKQFSPEIESDIASRVVVSGKLTNKEGYQSVKLSKSIPISEDYIYQPLSFCRVSIWDENGNEFQMYEHQSGEYGVWMNSANLKIGSAYYIQIFTPEGDELRSDPDIMTAVAPACIPAFQIDSIYNQAFDYYTKGLRFKVNVDGNETTSKYYLFELDPTYEHHVKYAREWYYNGGWVRHIYPPDSSLMYCWTTERVPEIFTLSTENLSANKFNNFNLHFVPYNKDYLTIGYSLLFRQVGLSRNAFLYWENMRLNNNQGASLYSKQPVDTKGNIINLTHPEKEVLGFFSASAISEARIFIEPQPTKAYEQCFPEPLDRPGLRGISPSQYPAFLMNDPYGTYKMIYLDETCVNCAADHGSPLKPDFWPY